MMTTTHKNSNAATAARNAVRVSRAHTMATHGLALTLALILALALVISLAPLQARGQSSDTPPVVSCGIDQIIIRETDRGRLALLEFDPPPFGLTYSTLIDQNVDWSPNIVIQFNMTLAIGADVKVHRESLNNPPIASWTAVTTRHLDVTVPNVEITCNVPITFFIHVVQVVDGEGRIDQCDYRYRVTYKKPCPTVFGDPQFAGLRGQSYQVHGIDGAVYALISAPTYAVNSRFDFLDGPRPCAIVPSTGRRSMACWTHPGSYLGVVGVRTVSGAELVIHAGPAATGFASVTLNGKELPIADRFVCAGSVGSSSSSRMTATTCAGVSGVTEHGGSNPDPHMSRIASRVVSQVVPQNDGLLYVVRNNTHELELRVGEFELTLENNDMFINLRAVRVSPEDWRQLALKHVHGLLGQTWQMRRYSGAVKEIEGEVDDYVIEEEHVLGHRFVFSRYVETA